MKRYFIWVLPQNELKKTNNQTRQRVDPDNCGHALTRRVKEHERLKQMPVIVFSSLVSQDNQKKCEPVGADAQITKPQLDQLVDLLDRLLAESQAKKTSNARDPATA